ncbi:hypothetical protein HHI36_014681 [Cryptolaemus montrouzieri]|uniref:Uncharacterized protein n=1 Tax=Cryptolaemus montrouzieri TaxID=559131 RepID=A0ABD2N3T6_9CUCU
MGTGYRGALILVNKSIEFKPLTHLEAHHPDGGKEEAVRDRSSIKRVERDQRASNSTLIDTDAKRQFPRNPSNLNKVNNNNQETADLLEGEIKKINCADISIPTKKH